MLAVPVLVFATMDYDKCAVGAIALFPFYIARANPFKADPALLTAMESVSAAPAAEHALDECELCGLNENSPDPALPLSAGRKCPFRNGGDVYCRTTRKIRNINVGQTVLI